jgi:hypothetical protein
MTDTDDIKLVREALAGYHATVVYPGAREAFERVVYSVRFTNSDKDKLYDRGFQDGAMFLCAVLGGLMIVVAAIWGM